MLSLDLILYLVLAHNIFISELGWELLQARRERRKLILFAAIVHGNAPYYLQDPPPPPIRPV